MTTVVIFLIRAFLTGWLGYMVYHETGPWTVVFFVLVWLSTEANGMALGLLKRKWK